MDLNLYFSGPYPLLHESKDLLHNCPFLKEEGIYFWAVKQKETGHYLITYIGETSAGLYRRTKEHVIQTLGGNYQICDAHALVNGENKVLWNGLWRKGFRENLPLLLKNLDFYTAKAKEHLLVQKVFFAPIELEKAERRRLESVFAHSVKADDKASKLLPDDIRFLKLRPTEYGKEFTVFCNIPGIGMPAKLVI